MRSKTLTGATLKRLIKEEIRRRSLDDQTLIWYTRFLQPQILTTSAASAT